MPFSAIFPDFPLYLTIVYVYQNYNAYSSMPLNYEIPLLFYSS